MTNNTFSIIIEANKSKVWHTMLDDRTYRIWTQKFQEGSYYEGSWDKGSDIRFLATDNEGKTMGMFSQVNENIPYEFVSILHKGLISGDTIDTTSEECKKWDTSCESYRFNAINSESTELIVEIRIPDEYSKMLEEMWLVALQSLKEICEE